MTTRTPALVKRAVKNCVNQIGDAIGAAKRTLPRGAAEAMAKMLEQMLRDERIVRDERGSRPLTREDIDAAGVRAWGVQYVQRERDRAAEGRGRKSHQGSVTWLNVKLVLVAALRDIARGASNPTEVARDALQPVGEGLDQ
jgi:hypothetical protein